MDECSICDNQIDREALQKELERRIGDIPETCFLAAASSKFCNLNCALADIEKQARNIAMKAYPEEPSPIKVRLEELSPELRGLLLSFKPATDLSSLLIEAEPCDQFKYHYQLIIADRLSQERFDWFASNGWSIEKTEPNGLLVFRKPKGA